MEQLAKLILCGTREERREWRQKERKGRGGERRNQVEGRAHLFDKPSPHPSQNPSDVGGRGGREDTESVCAFAARAADEAE